MAHENSITVEFDGRFFNIPTVINGKQVRPAEAVRAFEAGRIKALGNRSFASEREAVDAAVRRSESFTPPRRRKGEARILGQ